ncbi:hypothetical protein ABIB30_000136 [Pedobacter sp. UYP1]
MINDHFRLSKLTLSPTKASNKWKYCMAMKKYFKIFPFE